MIVAGSIAANAATGAGLAAASIAVAGFLLHAGPALSGAPEDRLRRMTVIGGLIGLGCAVFVMFLSAVIS
jgi:hypothetical protein